MLSNYGQDYLIRNGRPNIQFNGKSLGAVQYGGFLFLMKKLQRQLWKTEIANIPPPPNILRV